MVDNIELEAYKTKVIKYIVSVVPERIRSVISNYLKAYNDIHELRLRLCAPLSFTVGTSNLITGIKLSRDDIQYCIDKLTDSNYYKNEEIMRNGYICLPYGLRAGVCGDVFLSNGQIKVLKSVSSINIRLPSSLLIDCPNVINHIADSSFKSSILILSAPCSGKTTLLRSLAYSLSSPPYQKRVCVVDTNRELTLPFLTENSICEYLSGYPKGYGISLATKYFNPEYIICDEIGSSEDALSILESQHSGVPLIASVHCDTFSCIKKKKSIASLIENGVFDTLIRIKRNIKSFDYEIKHTCDI